MIRLMGTSQWPRELLRFLKGALPEGRSLPAEAWEHRHRMILALLWLHVVGIPLFALARGNPLQHGVLEALPVAGAALAGSMRGSRRLRSGAATVGLMTSSAVLVHLSGGVIEVHFHFFVMLSIIALYNDWVPFLLAVVYVVVHHGTVGVLFAEDVYNHPAAINNPWKWAAIHGVFVLMASVAGLVAWRLAEEARARAELILNSAGEGIFGLDRRGLTTFVNHTAASMLGHQRPELTGRSMHHVLHHSYPDGAPYPVEDCPIYTTLADGKQRTVSDEVFWRKDGTCFPVEYTATPVEKEEEVVGTVVTFVDRTESREAEDKLRRNQMQLAEAQRLASVGSWEWDIRADRIEWSDELYRIFGLDPQDFEATYEGYRRYVHADDVKPLDDAVRNAIDQRQTFTTEHRIIRPDGTVRVLRALGKVVVDDADTVTGMIGSAQDITERKGLEERLKHDALHDSLTTLANRVLFRDRVEHALQRVSRNGDSAGVMFIDIDNFKNINDTLGHSIGDQLLQVVALRLRDSLRASDTAARLGGDEFAVLLEETSEAGMVLIANRLLGALQEPITLQGNTLVVKASIGIAFGTRGARVDELLRNADTAMYAAKRQGRNRYEVFEQAMHSSLVQRLETQADLEKALDNDEIVLYYQPIYRLDPLRVVGVEALARWQHPTKGIISPTDFIPIAEDTGLIVPLGSRALDLACRQLQQWERVLHPEDFLRCGINFSARQLAAPTLGIEVSRSLERYGVRPEQLVVEITESAFVEDRGEVEEQLRALADIGVLIAIDDFGTGYSSLSYLRRFPVRILKLDRYFLMGIDKGPEESAYAKAIVRLGHSIGLDVVAEGIETLQQLSELVAVGCDFGQGFLLAKPMPPGNLEEILSSSGTLADQGLALR
jgi:diguanylate cyclase (GGDEF)-like protein/PAS domain S-box-containing protein